MRELLKSQSLRLTDDLTAHVSERILSGEFAGGMKITESGLAGEYGVARPTARTAIDALVADGLLERHAHSPARVRTIRSDEISEILAVLEFAEIRALADAGRSSPDLRSVKSAVASSSAEFLVAIVAACSSSRMSSIHRSCSNELVLSAVRATSERVSPEDDMKALVAALFNGDAAVASEALGRIQEARREYMSIFHPA